MPKYMDVTSLLRFLLVGLANTAIGLVVIWSARRFLQANNVTANAVGYAVGLLVSFTLNKRWTFSFHGTGSSAFLRFLLVFAVSYATNLITVLGLAAAFNRDSFLFQVCGALPYSALFYLGCRWYVFPSVAPSSRKTTAPENLPLDES